MNLDLKKRKISGPKRDPLKKLKNDLKAAGLISDEELKNIEKEIDLEVNDAVEFALNAKEPDPMN